MLLAREELPKPTLVSHHQYVYLGMPIVLATPQSALGDVSMAMCSWLGEGG